MELKAGNYFGKNITQSKVAALILTEKTNTIKQCLPEDFHENPYFYSAPVGGGKELVRGREGNCAINDLIYHPAREVHSTHFNSWQVTKTFNIEITEERMQKVDLVYGDALALRKYANVKRGKDPLSHIYDEFTLQDAYSSLAIEGALSMKIAEMAKARIHTTVKDSSWLEPIRMTLEKAYQSPLLFAPVFGAYRTIFEPPAWRLSVTFAR